MWESHKIFYFWYRLQSALRRLLKNPEEFLQVLKGVPRNYLNLGCLTKFCFFNPEAKIAIKTNFQQLVLSATKRKKQKYFIAIKKLTNCGTFFDSKRKSQQNVFSKRTSGGHFFAWLNQFSLKYALFRLFSLAASVLNNFYRFAFYIFISLQELRNLTGHPIRSWRATLSRPPRRSPYHAPSSPGSASPSRIRAQQVH